MYAFEISKIYSFRLDIRHNCNIYVYHLLNTNNITLLFGIFLENMTVLTLAVHTFYLYSPTVIDTGRLWAIFSIVGHFVLLSQLTLYTHQTQRSISIVMYAFTL